MPLHPNVRRCTHIKVTGHRCGSPALKQEYFCYFHTRMIKGVQTRVDSQITPIALIENPEAIQAAIMHMIDAVLKGTIDNKRANIVLKALHIAVRNSRNVYFHIRQDDMVREVPNYAEQYLTEHPELNPPQPNPHVAPDALVRAAEPSSAGSTQDPIPENQGQENTSQETQNLNPPRASNVPTPALKKTSHPERARPSRESKDPHQANTGKGATGNSPHASETNREKARGQKMPPLTTRQSERWEEIKKLEASIEGAMHGNWRDLRTVFNAVGLTSRKPPSSQKVAPNRTDALSPGAEKA
jgi:hypothetical protein